MKAKDVLVGAVLGGIVSAFGFIAFDVVTKSRRLSLIPMPSAQSGMHLEVLGVAGPFVVTKTMSDGLANPSYGVWRNGSKILLSMDDEDTHSWVVVTDRASYAHATRNSGGGYTDVCLESPDGSKWMYRDLNGDAVLDEKQKNIGRDRNAVSRAIQVDEAWVNVRNVVSFSPPVYEIETSSKQTAQLAFQPGTGAWEQIEGNANSTELTASGPS